MFKQNEIQSLQNLQKEKQKFQNELTLQEIQSQLIKDYKMIEGQYKVLITIYELNDLQPKSLDIWKIRLNQKSACDSFVQVQVGNQVKKTQIKKQTNNPIFDEQLFFQFEKMSIQELDRSKILFNVYDTKLWGMSPSLIGCFQLDWTNIYFKRNHQIYRAWLTLYDPNKQLEGPVGYLLVNIAILGQNDQIIVHDSAYIKDPLVTIQDTITSPKMPLIDYSIAIQIYRAQTLIPIDFTSRQIQAYVIGKFSGNKVKTSTIKSLNPQWNECIKIGAQVPNKSKYLSLQVRNKNLFSQDDLIGILKIPFIDICSDDEPQTKWGHLYGPPMAGKDIQPYNYASKMQIYGDKIGSHYRGRLLYKVIGKKDIYTKNIKNKLLFKFPYRMAPVLPLKLFTLRIDLIQGSNLPILSQCWIQICLGQYTIKSTPFKMQNDLCQFYEMLEDKKVNLPENARDMPDLVIYFCDGLKEENRLAYVRIKAKDVVEQQETDKARVYQLRIDRSLRKVDKKGNAGYITAKISLFSSHVKPPHRKKTWLQKLKKKQDHILKIFLYRGQNLPSYNQSGDCDPYINFNFSGKTSQSSCIQSTFNPIWDQIYSSQLKVQDLLSLDIQKRLCCDVYNKNVNKKNYIGSFGVKINGKMRRKLKIKYQLKDQIIQIVYAKPRWYHVINQNVQIGNNMFGRVLVGLALFKKTSITQNNTIIPFQQIQKLDIFKSIQTQTYEKTINFFVIGLREMKIVQKSSILNALKNVTKQLSNTKVRASIKINSKKQAKQQQQVQQMQCYRLKSSCCQINKLYTFSQIHLPLNKSLRNYLQIKILDQKTNYIYGSNSICLNQMKNIFQDQQKKNGILDVEKLQLKLNKLNFYNNINKQNQYTNEVANIIQKRKQQNKKDRFGVPQEFDHKDQHIQQRNIQMDRMLHQFQQFQLANNKQYFYVKDLISSSSNNFIQHQNQKNSIDQQNIKLKLYNQSDILVQQDIQYSLKNQQQDRLVQQKNIKHDKLNHEKHDQNKINRFSKNKNQLIDHNSKQINRNSKQINRNSKQINNKLLNRGKLKSTRDETITKNGLNIYQNGPTLKQKFQQNNSHVSSLSNFNLNQSLSLSESPQSHRQILFHQIQPLYNLQQQHIKQAISRQQKYKYLSAVKLSLFKWMRKQHQTEKETYQDYDTDQEQDLDVVPQWYKGRNILEHQLEHYLKKTRTIHNINVYRTNQPDHHDVRVKSKVGTLKLVAISSKQPSQVEQLTKYYSKLLRTKQFACRIYILKGKSLLSCHEKNPNTYLRFRYGDKITQYKQLLVKQQRNPQYYMCHQQWITLPGPSTIRIEIMQVLGIIGLYGESLIKDRILGFTQIDIEDRYFIKNWHLFDKKPIELRNLMSEFGVGTQGRLETWVDLVEKKNWLLIPKVKIVSPPYDQYQLRIVVWATKDCVYKNQATQSNDVFVRGRIGTGTQQETDVHWACRSLGSFNFRFKFNVFYPPKPEDMYSDVFVVQIWDKDVIGYNNLIGQTKINLNKMHKLIQKAVKRKKPVTASKRIIQKNMVLTDKFWFDVFNHKQKNEFGQLQPQGKVQLSFQLVPIQTAKSQRVNGYGRAQPNVYPTLAQPTGRLSLNILNPLDFMKQLLGPNLYRSICTKFLFILCIVVLVILVVLFGSSIVAGVIAAK